MTEQEKYALLEELATYFRLLWKKIMPDPINADKKDLNEIEKCRKKLIELGAIVDEHRDEKPNADSITQAVNELQPPTITYDGKKIGSNPILP